MKARTTYLLHPAFIFSLLLLAINDWYLKGAYANMLTGKLSDIAGLIAFTLFLFHFFPGRKKAVLTGVILFFAWWKSPLSSPVIFFLNGQWHIPVQRVIDYTDLLALLPLPLLLFLQPVAYTNTFLRQVALYSIGAVAFTFFTATTMIRHLTDDNREEVEKYITVKKSEAEIIQSLEDKGIEVKTGIPIYEKLWRSRYYLRTKDSSNQHMIPLDSLYTGVYSKIEYGTTYTIPRLAWESDTLYNLQLIISEKNKRRQEIRLHSVERRTSNAEEAPRPGNLLSNKDKRKLSRYFKKLVE